MSGALGSGGARPGAGRPRGSSIADHKRCSFEKADGERCGNAIAIGSDNQRCRFHGGATREASLEKQQQIVNAATRFVPNEVTVADFPIVAAEYIAMFNAEFAQRQADLNKLREDPEMNSIELLREYGDVYAAQERTALVVTKLMEAAAKLGIAETVLRLKHQQLENVMAGIYAVLRYLGIPDTADPMYAEVREIFLKVILEREAQQIADGTWRW